MDYSWSPSVNKTEALVRLADDARKCVVFFGTTPVGSDNDLDPWGTGFLVVADDKHTIYLVTARHVVQDKLDCPFAIRFNDRMGGSKNVLIDFAEWEFHPTDETVDVAILEIQPPSWADWVGFPQKPAIMDAAKFQSKDIGPGDIIYTVGLWRFLPGKKLNKPFVHVGHLGMVPGDEKLIVKDWMPGRIDEPVAVEGYLTEGEPLHGASGSPVFVRRSIQRNRGTIDSNPQLETWVYGTVWLLGLLSDCYFERVPPGMLAGEHVIPRGTNIVVPSMKINEILDKPSLKAKRADTAVERKRIEKGRASTR